jgi:hypothetical protein
MGRFTPEKLEVMTRMMAEGQDSREIAEALGFSHNYIKDFRIKLRKQGVVDNFIFDRCLWTQQDLDALAKGVELGMTAMEIRAEFLPNRTVDAILKKARYVGKGCQPALREWTDMEVDKLQRMATEGILTYREMGEMLNRSRDAVMNKLHQIGGEKGTAPTFNRAKACWDLLMALIEDYSGVPRYIWEKDPAMRVQMHRDGLAEYRAKCVKPEAEIPMSDRIRLTNAPARVTNSASYVGSQAALCADFG